MITLLTVAVSKHILSSFDASSHAWISAISHLLSSHSETIKVHILLIHPHAELILQELAWRTDTVVGIQWWIMSRKDAEYFAGKFVKCIQDYPFILADYD